MQRWRQPLSPNDTGTLAPFEVVLKECDVVSVTLEGAPPMDYKETLSLEDVKVVKDHTRGGRLKLLIPWTPM